MAREQTISSLTPRTTVWYTDGSYSELPLEAYTAIRNEKLSGDGAVEHLTLSGARTTIDLDSVITIIEWTQAALDRRQELDRIVTLEASNDQQ